MLLSSCAFLVRRMSLLKFYLSIVLLLSVAWVLIVLDGLYRVDAVPSIMFGWLPQVGTLDY